MYVLFLLLTTELEMGRGSRGDVRGLAIMWVSLSEYSLLDARSASSGDTYLSSFYDTAPVLILLLTDALTF